MSTEILITRTKDEPGATTLTVEAPPERVQAEEKKAAAQYAKRVRLPGFRKGKVPIDVVRRRFGDAIREAAVQELVRESWRRALDQESLEPLAEPMVRDLKIAEGSPLTFEFLVEVKPEVALERISGFTVTKSTKPVTDEMVDDQLDELRRQKAPWVPVEDERAKPGDMVRVTIATSTDGEPDEGKPYDLVIGQDQALPEIEEQIMALDAGETGEKAITFPPDHPDESKRGQTIYARIELHEIKRQALPELDDAFAGEVGDFDSAGALRAAVREDLERSASRDADADVRRQIIEQVVAANSVPAPEPLVRRLLGAYRQAYQIPEEQLEQFSAEFAPIAEAQVRRDLIIDGLAQAHDLAATEDDVDERVEEIANARGLEPGKVYANLQKENRLRELERSITEKKVFDFLLEQSTVNES